MDGKSMIVTSHGEFYRATNSAETRYYALSKKDLAREFDAASDLVIVGGFAVYDSTISTIFAVGLYATLAEAEAHEATPAPQAPTGVFPAETDTTRPKTKRFQKPATNWSL